MSNEKQTQVFDQADLDSLMAEIQKADEDPNSEEASPVAETGSSEAGLAPDDEVAGPPPPSEQDKTSEDGVDEQASSGPPLEQEDLDGLIDALNQEGEDRSKTAEPDLDGQDQESAVLADSKPAGTPAAEGPTPGSDASSASDGSAAVMIDQSELEALIKELQEGVEGPATRSSHQTEALPPDADARKAPPASASAGETQAAAPEPTRDKAETSGAVDAPPPEPVQSEDDGPGPSASSEESENRNEPEPTTAGSFTERTDAIDRSPETSDKEKISAGAVSEPGQPLVERIDPSHSGALPTDTSTNSKRKVAVGLVIVAMLVVVIGVLYVRYAKTPSPAMRAQTPEVDTPAQPVPDTREANRGVAEKETPLAPIDHVALINDKLEAVSALREALLTKHSEVLALKQHYQRGIAGIQKEILEELNKQGIKSYPRAIKNNRIELGLQTIQRRMAYIEQLNQPLQWLDDASEELLFVNRLITIDIRMLDTVSGIDLETLEAQVNEAIQNYQPSVGHLAISYSELDLPPLKGIWDKMFQPIQQRNGHKTPARTQPTGRNQVIWREICQGNYQHKSEITALSPEAAKCLAKAEEADLFLNGINNLTPEAAKNLFAWQGNWVCLNGLSRISSETARYLFSWNGNWISLNGLKELSAEAARHVAQWPGRQLELMGLDFKGDPQELHMLTYLSEWKQAGGKLYVPDKVEKQIAKLMH